MPTDPYALAAAGRHRDQDRFGVAGLDAAFVLGSGWSAAADDLGELIGSCPLAELPGFAAPTVLGHGGTLRLVRTAGRPDGRRSSPAAPTSTRPATSRRSCTAYAPPRRPVPRRLVLTNGCGGLNRDWGPGTAVLIADHINLTGASPLLGATFIDLTEAYSRRLRALARDGRPGAARGRLRAVRRPSVRDAGRGADGGRPRRRPGRHVDRAGDHRGPRGRAGGARHLAGHQPGRRHLPGAAEPPGGARGRARAPRRGCGSCWPASPPRCDRACDPEPAARASRPGRTQDPDPETRQRLDDLLAAADG